jgi:hypothetical protein
MSLVQPLQYVPFVKPYVEGSHKEYKELQDRLIKDYDENLALYDSLKEAADNLKSLNAENDIAAKKAAFEKAYSYIEEASKLGDYENRGRIVRKAIKDFAKDYKDIIQQVEDRNKYREEIDKRKDITTIEAETIKAYVDNLYKENKGFRKDPVSGNIIGYSNYTLQPPKTVNFIEKLTNAFSGVTDYKFKEEYEKIVKDPTSDFNGKVAKIQSLIKFIPENTIRSIVKGVLNDSEVKDYLDFWAKVKSHNATPEQALVYLNKNLQETKLELLRKEPRKYRNNEKALERDAKLMMKNSGLDVDYIANKVIQEPRLAPLIVEQGIKEDKSRELFGFAYNKYGNIERETSTTYSNLDGSGKGGGTPDSDVIVYPQPGVKKEYDLSSDILFKDENKDNLAISALVKVAEAINGVDKTAPEYIKNISAKVTLEKFKTTPEEEAKGITPISKAIELLQRALPHVKDKAKRDEIASTIEKLKFDDLKYQDYVNTANEYREFLEQKIGKDKLNKYFNHLKTEEEKLKEYKENKKEQPRNFGDWYSITKSDNLEVKTQFTTVPKEIKGISSEIEKYTKEFNDNKNQVSVIKTYTKIGQTQQELESSETLLKQLSDKNNLFGRLGDITGYELSNNTLGQRLTLKSILSSMTPFKSDDKLKESIQVTAGYVKAPLMTKEGLEPGVILNVTSGNNTKKIFIPASSVYNNMLQNIIRNQTPFDVYLDYVRAQNANKYKLPLMNDVINVGGKQIDLSKKQYWLIFDEDRSGFTLKDQEAYEATKNKK